MKTIDMRTWNLIRLTVGDGIATFELQYTEEPTELLRIIVSAGDKPRGVIARIISAVR